MESIDILRNDVVDHAFLRQFGNGTMTNRRLGVGKIFQFFRWSVAMVIGVIVAFAFASVQVFKAYTE